MSVMKQVVLNMSNRRSAVTPASPRTKAKTKRPFSGRSLGSARSEENISSPAHYEFVSQGDLKVYTLSLQNACIHYHYHNMSSGDIFCGSYLAQNQDIIQN